MKKRVALLVLAFVVIAIFVGLSQTGAPSREALWKKVDDAMSKGLPKTAIENIEPIIASAIKDKAYPEAIKAVALKVSLEGNIQGNKPEEKITRLKAQIAKAPSEMVPVMDTILANWYWHYFEQNRYRFLRRTATSVSPTDDFTTWDLTRLFAEIDKQFTKALGAEKTLKTIPIAQYDALLDKGSVPDSYRPTLYDFLVNNALTFYQAGEQAGNKAEDAFELTADSPIFGAVDEFMRWKIQTADVASHTVKAVRLYQDLLAFHQEDKDRSAFLDADVNRLRFGYNRAVGEDKNARYKAALKRYVEKCGPHEIAALGLSHWAQTVHAEGDFAEAHRLAGEGVKRFPDSVGGKHCYNLVQQIEAKSTSVSTERVWNDPLPTIDVTYRNVTRVYFRAIPENYRQRIKATAYRPERLNEDEQKALLSKQPALEWLADLPATADFKERLEKLPAPKGLKPGFYYLVASHDKSFQPGDNNPVNFTNFWVSNLALVIRNHQNEGVIEGFVLDTRTGDPIPKADVQAWVRNDFNPGHTALQPTTTDDNGLFRFTHLLNATYLLLAHNKDQELSNADDGYANRYDARPKPQAQTIFFTDRSLYRPGQAIQYRGICIEADQQNDNYKVLGNQPLTVVFADVNRKEIARQVQRTNDYGSFSASFTAPSDRLMGRMTIRVEGEPRGATSVTVEEYKRPKFQVTLERPKTAGKLGGEVTVHGKAMAYTGAAIDGAKLCYRVVRETRYPTWWACRYWWRTPVPEAGQEITHGVARTGLDGTFKVDFNAKPDPRVSAKDEPTFHFTVYADVTDNSGETRTNNIAINVGYTALRAELTADSWQTVGKAVEVTVRTTTLGDEPQQVAGIVKVYRLKEPRRIHRPDLQIFNRYVIANGQEEPAADPTNPDSWEQGDVAGEKAFKTDAAGKARLGFDLGVGVYRAVLQTEDRFGKRVTARLALRVLDPTATKLAIKVPQVVAGPKWKLEPGSEFLALWGTGYSEGRAFIEIEHRHKTLQSFWTNPQVTQATVKQAVTEAMRGGFTLRVTMVRENRAYLSQHWIDVPWSNKELKVKWEHFTNKLEPGKKETWTAIVTGPDAKKAVAEMVATLYDESLDAYLPHKYLTGFGVFRQDYSKVSSQFENQPHHLQWIGGSWQTSSKDVQWTYRTFPDDVMTGRLWTGMFHGNIHHGLYAPALAEKKDIELKAPAPVAAMPAPPNEPTGGKGPQGNYNSLNQINVQTQGKDAGGDERPQAASLDKVSARKNLNETAFFFPQLLADKDGEVKMVFTMPEALTKWKFMGFAHDKDLRSGYLQDSAVTARELMVQPNPPRFLREGDLLEFAVKVSNQSEKAQTGTVRLSLADARTGKAVDALLGNTAPDVSFNVPAKESRSYSWRLKVPDDIGYLTYKAVAAAGQLTDGEEGYLPVLPRRILVTESLPLPIRGPATKNFTFTRLKKSAESDTLRHKQLTVQVVSNPSWYAVMALPYLMEYPYECSEQTFNRLYANTLARHIANSDPKIKRIFEQWRGTSALDSPLEKNQDLRAVRLEETPWLRQAQNESQARRNVGILFDDNRLANETVALMRKLADTQNADGAWTWFPGGPPNDYITLYITTGFGRLKNMNVAIDTALAIKAVDHLDGWIDRVYRDIIRHGNKDKNNLSPTIALYLYGRTFFLKDKDIVPQSKEAVDYFLRQAKTHWLKLDNRQSQAHLALALNRWNEKDAAQAIMRSLKERAVTNEEMGMFWRDLELSWWWFRAPIETQAVMIEAFAEVMNDANAVEECKVWLLKQKQTQDWKTTKATADAVYALLMRGANPLISDALVEIQLDNTTIKPEKVEGGTGFYEKRFQGSDVKPEMGDITVKKVEKGAAWGSVNWQYFEDVSKVTAYEGTPLTLKKTLYTKQRTNKGPVLQPVAGPLEVGEEMVVRLVLRVDRDMEYVHLKDARGSGTEPVNVLSRYRYQNGLAYYETTRDTASHFFIDYLPKGTYVFEYSTRVVHRGEYQTGMAEIQSMYAPEFNSHSESYMLVVK